jgi:hypothetical protein
MKNPCKSKSRRPRPGERWRDKEQPDRYVGTIQGFDKNSPGLIPIRFDGYNTVALFQSDHFFDWLEPVPAGGQE